MAPTDGHMHQAVCVSVSIVGLWTRPGYIAHLLMVAEQPASSMMALLFSTWEDFVFEDLACLLNHNCDTESTN